jgi:hypothetical protein
MSSYAWYVDLEKLLSEGAAPLDNGGTQVWMDLMRVGKYNHPTYGEIDFTPTKLQEYADNVNNNVRGIPLSIDYDHSSLKTGISEAAGWVQQARFNDGVLQGLVDFTKTATEKIKEGAYRYFSPEYKDEWINNAGQKVSNVLLGGGLTNRPFLKDLLPINLSELSFDRPSVVPGPTKENEVDPKQLRVSIGLAEDATDEAVTARLALIKQLSEAFPAGPPTPPVPPEPPKPVITLGPDIKALAEANPAAAALVAHLEDQTARMGEMTKQLREEQVARQLAEFDDEKIALTPVAKQLASKVLSDPRVPQDVAEQIYSLMNMMKTGNSFVVQLGEIASTGSRIGRREKTATMIFNEQTETYMGAPNNMKYPDAVERVAKENPKLYDEYRNESFSFVE